MLQRNMHFEPERLVAAMKSLVGLRNSRLLVQAHIVVVTLLIGLALVLLGRTFSTIYGEDLSVFLDGAWRRISGQLSTRDLHPLLGLIACVLPVLALVITGSLRLMVPLPVLSYAVSLLESSFWRAYVRTDRRA